MELRPAYKKTDVGVIPEDWEIKAVGDLGQIRTGPFGTLLKAEEYSGSNGVPLISVGEIGHGTFRITNKTPLVPEVVVNRLPQYVLRVGDIVFGRKGAVDRSVLVDAPQDGWFLGSDGISLRPSQSCHAPYLAWQFRRHQVQSWLLQNAVGTTMASLNQAVLSGVRVPIAPEPEQRAIASALSDVDALLAKLDQLIAKKRDLKQAAMQQLLTGQTRLPGFDEPWESKCIGEFTDCTAGGTPSTTVAAYWGGSIRWMSSGELNMKRVNDVAGRISEQGLKNSSTKIIPSYCVLVGLAGQGKTRGTVAINYVELCTNQSIAAIFPNASFDPTYLYYNLDARYDELRSLSTGDGGRGGLNLRIIRSISVPFPPIAEQTAIATVLSDMDAEIAALEARRDKTHALKQGMMQALLTGRIRLV
ncbi:restriction endonuclease subunit S [Ramlibacter sp. 2FC]|uniref:restriction endonuclease subunit S n=1 Tax=Ramlibacter sp. 2FC TaxID=2502188 RepID=UPI0010FA309A|nr:restriction endonuclease subunit S [Ramlibacter sp. 2FC]